MVVDQVSLPEERRLAGIEILALTDRVGFEARGAGWGFSDAGGSWRFFLFSDMADSKGPLWVWERLLKAFSKLSLPSGITPLDIVVASPEERLYREVPVKVDGSPAGLSFVVASGNIAASGYGIDRLWLLRSRPEHTLRKHAARKFDLKVRQLMAA